MSDLKKKYEVMDYLKRNKSKFSYAPVRVVCEEVRTMFDATYSQYVMRKMMDAAGVPLKRNLTKNDGVGEPQEPKDVKDKLNDIEKKIDFICDFIQYAKTGEVPQ